jgi:hypothetical protein
MFEYMRYSSNKRILPTIVYHWMIHDTIYYIYLPGSSCLVAHMYAYQVHTIPQNLMTWILLSE